MRDTAEMRTLTGFVAVMALAAAVSYVALEQPWADDGEVARSALVPAAVSATVSMAATPAPEPEPEPTPNAVSTAESPVKALRYSVDGCGTPRAYGDSEESFESDQGTRAYRLHIPPGYERATPAAVVISYHGYGRTAIEQEAYSGLVPLSDRETFILVTPEGSGYPQAWDIPGIYAENGFDDVNFTVLLIAHLSASVCIDLDRVYATGMSNGGEMAALVGCRHPDLFAAVAPVAGVIFDACDGGPMPVIAFHGTGDYNVPFEGARPAMYEWAVHNACELAVVVEAVSENVTSERYNGCAGGADLVLFVVAGGGHTWPGAAPDSKSGVGATTEEINASELIWAFFKQHRRADLGLTP